MSHVNHTASKPLSVVFLNPLLGQGWGGVGNWMLQVGEYLRKRGHRVVYAGDPGSMWLQRCAERGHRVWPMPIRSDFHPRSVWLLRKCIAENRVDLICVKLPKGLRLAGAARLLFADPRPAIICRMGDSMMQRTRRARITYRWLADSYITPSERVRQDLLAYGYFGPERVDCVPNGVRWVDQRPDVRERVRREFGVDREKLLLVNSRLHPAKGHRYLFEAVAQLSAQWDLRLLVVGNGAHRDALKALAARLGLGETVIFAGFRTDVFDLLQGADVAVLPSLLEGLPNNLLEAMACGKPVVATAVDGVPEAVIDGQTGLLVPPGDSAAIARAIANILVDESLARRLGQAACERVRRLFSEDAMLARSETVFLARRSRVQPPALDSRRPLACVATLRPDAIPSPRRTPAIMSGT